MEKINKELKGSVLELVDKLYDNLPREQNIDFISVPILEELSFICAQQNSELHFIFEEKVIPYFQRMKENDRLQKLKELLTVGYIDIKKERIYLRTLNFLNRTENEPPFPYISEIPSKSTNGQTEESKLPETD